MNIGLTGGIGCGKSTVVRLFAESGWNTLETDRVVAALLQKDKSVREQLRGRWGGAVFKGQGGDVDRKAIARIVFSDAEELNWLEQVLHPEVRRVWTQALEADPRSDWLVEIPLLFEKSLESHFDLVVCIASSDAVSDCRLAERGYGKAEINRRRNRQMSLEKKILYANHVLFNSGSMDFLKRQTQRLIKQLRTA